MKSENTLSFRQFWSVAFEAIKSKGTNTLTNTIWWVWPLITLEFFITVLPHAISNTRANEAAAIRQILMDISTSVLVAILMPLIVTSGFFRSELSLKKIKATTFIMKNLRLNSIETLRSFFKIMLFAVLLVLPGLYKLIQLQFVPYIVALQKSYKAGDRDALKTSTHISNGIMIPLFIYFVVTQVILFLPLMLDLRVLDSYGEVSFFNLASLFGLYVIIFGSIRILLDVGLTQVFVKQLELKEGPNELEI